MTKQRAHSKFSASGSERWINCPASVRLEEQSPPSKDSIWSIEGTTAHDLLEKHLAMVLNPGNEFDESGVFERAAAKNPTMVRHVERVTDYVLKFADACGGEIFSETRITQEFIHPEMFGTGDISIVALFDVLHIIDFKYGQTHIVNPEENTQLLQYALGVAHKYDWNFKKVGLHIAQPRVEFKNWWKSWYLPMKDLKGFWLPHFAQAVAAAEDPNAPTKIGKWCYWCRAKAICPAKEKISFDKIVSVFERTA